MSDQPKYTRVIVKLSGESFGDANAGIDLARAKRIVAQLKILVSMNVQIGLVIGAGNFVRGSAYAAQEFNQETADYMGMTATLINGLALKRLLQDVGVKSHLFSALSMPTLATDFSKEAALQAFDTSNVLIFAGGAGRPFITTDTAAAQYGRDIQAQVILKATKVDGVYDKDPKQHADAKHHATLDYQTVLDKQLAIMDREAIEICQQIQLPIRVFDMNQEDVLKRVVMGEALGTLIH